AWPAGDRIGREGCRTSSSLLTATICTYLPARTVHTLLLFVFPLLFFSDLSLSSTRFDISNASRIASCTEKPLIAGHAITTISSLSHAHDRCQLPNGSCDPPFQHPTTA
ncbi:uncharacterized protein M437DRAFT_55775, partial [Aureobasidium melanogenum CBS 110374]